MARVVEKHDGTVRILVNLTLKPGRDDAAIQLVLNAPPRTLAALVREAMRSGIPNQPLEGGTEFPIELELPDIGIDL